MNNLCLYLDYSPRFGRPKYSHRPQQGVQNLRLWPLAKSQRHRLRNVRTEIEGRFADPLDGARVALLQRVHAQVGRVEFRHPHVGDRHVGLHALPGHGGSRGHATGARRLPTGEAVALPPRPLQDHFDVLVRRHE